MKSAKKKPTVTRSFLWLKITGGVLVAAGLIALLVWLFTTWETAAYVDEVAWEHHVRLLEDYTDIECDTEIDDKGVPHTECEDVTRTRELQHEKHEGTNGLDSVTWPSVSRPWGRQYVQKEAIYTVHFYHDQERWNYTTGSISDAKRFKPGKLWLLKVNRVRMVWPQWETGAEG